MQLSIVEEYPSGAVSGADFFTRASRGDIIEQGPDGPVVRPEKVVITDRFVDMDDPVLGQICVGERTIRHLAHAFGMIDGWRVARVVDDNAELRAELVALSKTVGDARAEAQALRDLEIAKPPKTYVAIDGTEHESRRAALEAGAAQLGVVPKIITDAVPVPIEDATAKEPV